MTALPPSDVPAIFWIDAANQQQGPEPLATVIERIAHDQIPATTPVWWQGAVNWAPFNSTPELASALDARLGPVAAAPVFEQPVAASPFSQPAPAESASPFQAPAAVFETPSVYEQPAAVFEQPTTYEQPAAVYDQPITTFEQPAAVYEQPASFEPAPNAYEAQVTYDAPTGYDPSATQVMAAPVEAPVVTDVPEIILPDAAPASFAPEPAAEPVPAPVVGLNLGDTDDLAATFAQLTDRSGEFDAEVARAAALDDTLDAMIRQSITDLGFTLLETSPSDDYHSFRLSEPDGSTASLAVQRVPPAISVAAATERPLACFVDRSDRASVGLFLGDYLGADGVNDQSLFTSHLAAVVNAAGQG